MIVDARTREVQSRASDPMASAWVSANAGSGKTFVLSRRVIRLLLAGANPASILCLTFTKAAAAEMAARVFGQLAEWTTLADAELDGILDEFEGPADSLTILNRRIRARRLFARALETPGGLKIQTIHAFCERLLHQFPLEANVAGSFDVLDDRDASILLADAKRRTIGRAAAAPETALGRSFARVLDAASDQGIDLALEAIIGARDALRSFLPDAGHLSAAIVTLRQSLGLAPGEIAETLQDRLGSEIAFSDEELRRLVDRLSGGSPRDQEASVRLAPILSTLSPEDRGAAWIGFLTTQAGELRKVSTLVTKSIKDGWPGLEERLEAELRRVDEMNDKIAAAAAVEATAALLTLGNAVIDDYEANKQSRGVLDFEDLVVKTSDLLRRSEAAAWVHYKLDRGLDHILVDEAQDTSPRQWQVIEQLSGEFFAGSGARDPVRTFFAVGDEKQSIYSFQGAVPAWFARQRDKIGDAAIASGALWHALELTLSFRSTPDVLAAVDAVFAVPEAHYGLTQQPQPTQHQAARRNDPGRVTFWQPIAADKKPEPEDWHTPLDRLDDKSPEVRLAERIAGTIQRWQIEDARILATGKPIRPGNILILTRRRGAQTDAINRALKAAGLAVAGADRLALGSHIAVLDLLALADVMLQPRDELALAALLKSPLLGLSEEELFERAHGRSGSLFDLVLGRGDQLAEQLRVWRARADFMAPYAFFARILGPDGGRRKLLARLGPEAEDVLDEFLAQALAFERSAVPSLQGFIAWMRSAATQIKRDADVGRDEIRVMTVHGAKGLEAEIVFVVDTGSKPVHASHDPRIVALADDPDDAVGAPLVWVAPGTRRPERVQQALEAGRERAAQEYRRLLYVGLTRAKDHLIVCGTAKSNTGSDRLWSDLVGTPLQEQGRIVPVTLGEDRFDSVEWRQDWDRPPVAHEILSRSVAAAPAPLPHWVDEPPPAGPAIARRLTPSAATGFAEAEPAFPAVTALDARLDPDANAALDRGRIVHRLLQALPDHPPAARVELARLYLGEVAPHWPEARQTELVERITALIGDPAHAELFGSGGRAEVPIAGTLATGSGVASVSGRIDRLLVTPNRVVIVDFKTNRPPPQTLENVPAAYVAQLALYRAVLSELYPDRPIETALLWTETPSLMPIPAALLDRSLAAILRPVADREHGEHNRL